MKAYRRLIRRMKAAMVKQLNARVVLEGVQKDEHLISNITEAEQFKFDRWLSLDAAAAAKFGEEWEEMKSAMIEPFEGVFNLLHKGKTCFKDGCCLLNVAGQHCEQLDHCDLLPNFGMEGFLTMNIHGSLQNATQFHPYSAEDNWYGRSINNCSSTGNPYVPCFDWAISPKGTFTHTDAQSEVWRVLKRFICDPNSGMHMKRVSHDDGVITFTFGHILHRGPGPNGHATNKNNDRYTPFIWCYPTDHSDYINTRQSHIMGMLVSINEHRNALLALPWQSQSPIPLQDLLQK
jgi:hypothetical protein